MQNSRSHLMILLYYTIPGIRGQVEICQKVPEDIRNHMKKLVESLSSMENKNKRKRKRKSLYEIVRFEADPQMPIQVEPPIFDPDPDQEDAGEETEEDEHGDDFVISPHTGGRVRSKKQRYASYLTPQVVTPISRNGSGLRDPVRAARLAMARWWYDAKVPFDGARSRYYQEMVDSLTDAGPGFEGPSYHDLRGPLLKEVYDEIKEYLFGIRNIWRIYGCSIMVDRLVNNGKTQIINFLVFSARGTVFLKSVDVSSTTSMKNEAGLVDIFDEVVRDVGPENVVQFITDTDKDFKAAGKAVQDRYGTFFWSPCAANCIDLMLENLSDPRYFSNIDETLKKARKITNFIYNRAWVLSLMRRDFTNGRDLTRPSLSRFATHFLTLQCLLRFKKELKQMFTCNKWLESEFGKSSLGTEISRIVLQDKDFWTQCQHIVKVTEPLIRVLRLVDSDERPSMGYLFEAMEGAKESIRLRMKNKASLCGPYLRVIDTWWDKQLSSPLHAAGCFLNPGIYFRPGFAKQEVTRGLLMTISRLVQDYEVQDMISAQLEEYKDSAGDFGLPIAVRQREKLNPGR